METVIEFGNPKKIVARIFTCPNCGAIFSTPVGRFDRGKTGYISVCAHCKSIAYPMLDR